MSWKTLIPFVVAIALGVVAVKLGRDLYQEGRAPRDTVKVVAAVRDLDPGMAIQAADVTLMDVPASMAPPSALTKTDLAINRVVSMPIPRNMPVSDQYLAPVGAGAGLAGLVPSGMRAVAIEVTESSGMTSLLAPGTYVDVIGTLIDQRTRQPVARTIVESVKVTAVGPRLAPRNKTGADAEPPARTVTLVVTPRQAEMIELAAAKTRLRLAMRGTGDTAARQSDGVVFLELFGPAEPPAQPAAATTQPALLAQATTQPAAPAAPVSYRVVVIRRGNEGLMSIPNRLAEPADPGAIAASPAQPQQEESSPSPSGADDQGDGGAAVQPASLH